MGGRRSSKRHTYQETSLHRTTAVLFQQGRHGMGPWCLLGLMALNVVAALLSEVISACKTPITALCPGCCWRTLQVGEYERKLPLSYRTKACPDYLQQLDPSAACHGESTFIVSLRVRRQRTASNYTGFEARVRRVGDGWHSSLHVAVNTALAAKRGFLFSVNSKGFASTDTRRGWVWSKRKELMKTWGHHRRLKT